MTSNLCLRNPNAQFSCLSLSPTGCASYFPVSGHSPVPGSVSQKKFYSIVKFYLFYFLFLVHLYAMFQEVASMLQWFMSFSCSKILSKTDLEVSPKYLRSLILEFSTLASFSPLNSSVIFSFSLSSQLIHQVSQIRFIFLQQWEFFFSSLILVRQCQKLSLWHPSPLQGSVL